jgi:hypothetical protein
MTARWLVLLGLSCALGCSKKPAPPHRTEPWLAHPSASAGNSGVEAPLGFHFTDESSVRFTLLGKKGKVSGRVPLALGNSALGLDPRDLKNSSASVEVDLSKLSVDAEALPPGVEGTTPTALALQWLELGPEVAREKRQAFASARFELVSLESSSSTTLDLGARRAKNRVRATIVGTLLLHGFRAPVRCDVVLAPLDTPTGSPPRLSIRSVGALVVALGPHDVVARSASGVADALATARSAEWVGKSVKVEFELVADADAGQPAHN